MDWSKRSVLVLEDDPVYIEFLADLISQSGINLRQFKHTTTLRETKQALKEQAFDVALIDLHVPDSAGLDTLTQIREQFPDLPIVVLTAQQETDYEEQALKAGAQEYLLKEEALPRLLVRVMNYAIERMRSEVSLRESEQRQRVILESAQVGLVVIEPQSHTIVEANPAALSILGRSKEDVIGCDCHHFICPSDAGSCPITDLGNWLDRSERELVGPDGALIPILKTVNTIQLNGRPHLLESFIDITEIKKARNVLEQSKQRLADAVRERTKQLERAKRQWEATFDTVPDLISIHDNDHKIIRYNKAMAERLKLNHHEIIGKSCCQLMHGTESPIPLCPHSKLLQDGQEHMVELTEPKMCGDFLISTSPLLNETGEVYACVHVARDISELKKAERALKSQLDFLNTIIETIPDPIFIKNLEGVYSGCNSAFAELLGLTRDAIIGKGSMEIMPKDIASEFVQQDQDLFDSPGVKTFEVGFNTPNKGLRHTVYCKSTFEDENGNIQGLVGVIHDITERKQMEEQLMRSQRLESIGLLAAGIAHEINTPTQFIHTNVEFVEEAFTDCVSVVGLVDRLAQGYAEGRPPDELIKELVEEFQHTDFDELDADVKDALKGTLEGVERITNIVDSMRYFSHPGTEQKELVDINQAIEHAITVSRNEWKYYSEIGTNLEEDLPPVSGYAGPLNQVLLNIIVNAAQAISGTLGDNPEHKGLISISTKQVDSMVEIRIADNGPGIEEDTLAKIFDPFFTTKEIGKGTGQGLALAHSVVVDKHEGSINVESSPGSGATFILQLPIKRGESSEAW